MNLANWLVYKFLVKMVFPVIGAPRTIRISVITMEIKNHAVSVGFVA